MGRFIETRDKLAMLVNYKNVSFNISANFCFCQLKIIVQSSFFQYKEENNF